MHRDMIVRVTKYDRILRKLKSIGLERVFANNIGDAVGVTASVVRKDFSLLNIIGQKRGGYDINKLITSLDNILGKDGSQKAAIVGCGRIGGALLRYNGFESDGIKIVAGFDSNTRISENSDSPVPIHAIEKLEEVIEREQIKLAIIAVPDQTAPDIFTRLLNAGVRGFLNFTQAGLRAPKSFKDPGSKPGEHIVVHNVNIGLELEQIVYELNMADKQLL
ncbi:MAG: redox-sensing transcriptional repressor Rex [Spirochaetales bacterium]|nr:redox-sensing transcriptional repressor Rex [Spirochaetales bacterium]